MNFIGIFKKIQKSAIVLFVVLNVVMMVTAALPNRSLLGSKVLSVFSYYQSFLGLQQSWNMFAPVPSSQNSYVEASIEFTDGSRERWTLPRPSLMTAGDKFLLGERYRKYSQEHLRPQKKYQVWMDLGKFTTKEVRLIESQGLKRDIKHIEFFHYSNFIPHPDTEFIPHGTLSKKFKEVSVLVYKPQESPHHEAQLRR